MKTRTTIDNDKTSSRHPKTKQIALLTAFLPILLMLFSFSFASQAAEASEGGSSGYTPGTYGDFAMNVVFPGLTIRENIFYTYGSLDKYPTLYAPGIAVEADLELKAWANMIQAVWSTDSLKILGGRYFAVISIPYAYDVDLKGSVGSISEKQSTDGLGDLQVVPLGIAWDKEYLHFSLAENIIAPTGQYNSAQLANVGRNYWGYETIFGLTWLNEERGHEISFAACYIFNTENKDTHYKTGDEFHFDYTLAQFFSEELAAGAVGYIYRQITDDSGSGYDALNTLLGNDLDGYKSSGAGIGPAVMWSPKVGGKPLSLVAKWFYEYEGDRRFKGGWGFVSASMTF